MTEQKPRSQGTIGASIDQYGFVYIGEQRFEPIEKRIAVELQLDQALKRIKILDAEIGEQKLKHNYAAFERNQCVENNSKLRSQLASLKAENQRLREALEDYMCPYCLDTQKEFMYPRCLEYKACKAIAEIKGAKP